MITESKAAIDMETVAAQVEAPKKPKKEKQ
jgi:hypothetical protein